MPGIVLGSRNPFRLCCGKHDRGDGTPLLEEEKGIPVSKYGASESAVQTYQ